MTVMPAIPVLIDPSQFPEQVRVGLHRCFRARRIDPKFHYESYKQTRAWLTLHESLSPARLDPGCQSIYLQAIQRVVEQVGAVHLIGLGCGGGQKDVLFLGQLDLNAKPALYTPVDVSVPMTLVATEQASRYRVRSEPTVCDLAADVDLEQLVGSHTPTHAVRVVTLFGMLPNLLPETILPKAAQLIRPGDFLLVSANLAPGKDYAAGLRAILPQYDNSLTAEWLMLFLSDLGFSRDDGRLRWNIEPAAPNSQLQGVVAYFELRDARRIHVEDKAYEFKAGESIQLFASWRYTPGLLATHLSDAGLRVAEQWIAPSGEEGVFQVEPG